MYAIAHYMYGKIDELISNYPDEKWNTAVKLRNATNDSLFYISQAVGSRETDATVYEWNNACKNLFSLQSMYLFAAKQNFLELEPEMIVRLDTLIATADTEIAAAKKAVERKDKEGLEPWMEKFRIWQKINNKD